MGMYAPQRPPAAGVRPRPFPISSAPAFERPNAVRANRCADGRADADGTWTAFLRRMCGTGKRNLPAVGAIKRSLRSIRDNFANVGSTRRCRLWKGWPRRGSRGSGRSQAADFEVQTLQVEAMKSGGWVAEREEAEEEEEIQSSRGHCPYSDSPLLLHAPLLMKDIALSVGEVEREGGGQFWMD